MTTEAEIKVGDFFVSSSGFGGNWQAKFMAKLVQWGTSSAVNHSGIFVGNGKVIEAQPGGVRYADISNYLGPNTFWSNGLGITDDSVRATIAQKAVSKLGVPYGYLDIIAIALAQKRLGSEVDALRSLDKQPWWVKRLARMDRLICSELVDLVYFESDIHLFDDGRPFQFVTPGDLHRLILQHTLGLDKAGN